MGSFNSCCAVTGIPIAEGDECYTWLAHGTSDYRENKHDGTDNLVLFSAKFETTYEDYGNFSVKDPDGFAFTNAISTLKSKLVWLPERKSHYMSGGPEVSGLMEIGPTELFDLIHDESLWVRHRTFRSTTQTMDRSTIEIDRKVSAVHVFKEFWDEEMIHFKFGDYDPFDLAEYVKMAEEDLEKKAESFLRLYKLTDRAKTRAPTIPGMPEVKDPLLAMHDIPYVDSPFKYESILDIDYLLGKILIDEGKEKLFEVHREFLDSVWLNTYIRGVGRQLSTVPSVSQDQLVAPIIQHAESLLKFAKTLEARNHEEDDDDFEAA